GPGRARHEDDLGLGLRGQARGGGPRAAGQRRRDPGDPPAAIRGPRGGPEAPRRLREADPMTSDRDGAIVTRASREIGHALARALAADGLRVVANYRDREREARDLVERIVAEGGQARAVRADVGTRAAADALVGAALDAFGRVDVLVNNAGVHLP